MRHFRRAWLVFTERAFIRPLRIRRIVAWLARETQEGSGARMSDQLWERHVARAKRMEANPKARQHKEQTANLSSSWHCVPFDAAIEEAWVADHEPAKSAAGDAPLDVERLAAAICASRPPEPMADSDWPMHVDDDCRALAKRVAAEYARLDSGAADTEGAPK
jgi:hypothetical protein